MGFIGSKHTPETRAKMSAAQKGRIITPEHRMKLRKANLGKKYSEETKRKVSEASKRMWSSEERRVKLSQSLTGKRFSESHKSKISKSMTGRSVSDETRKRISESWKHRKTYIRTPATKEKMRDATIRRMIENPGKRSGTSIEMSVRSALSKRGIEYIPNAPVHGFLVDIYIPKSKLVIECDGCYWHCCQLCNSHTKDARLVRSVIAKDSSRNSRLISAGYRVMRFWEHEIDHSVEMCVEKILDAL